MPLLATRHIHLGLTQDYDHWTPDTKLPLMRKLLPRQDPHKFQNLMTTSQSLKSFFHLFNQFSFQGFLLFNLPDVPVLEISWVNRQMSEMFTFRQKGQVV